MKWIGEVPISKIVFNNKEGIMSKPWMWNIYTQNILMAEFGSCYRFGEIIKIITASSSYLVVIIKLIFYQLIFEAYEYLHY